MHSLNQVNKLVSCGRDPARSLPLWRGFLLIPLILVCFAFAPQTRAVVPAPDGGYPGLNTAEGQQALQLLTSAVGNTGLGWRALFTNNGDFNTGVGAGALVLNFSGIENTAVGAASLLLNSAGSRNTAVGTAAMVQNRGDNTGLGSFNGAYGAFSLNNNTTGFSNNAVGDSALFRNMIAAANTAVGDEALENNDATAAGQGNNNVAVGAQALLINVNGSENTAVGAGVGPNLANGFNNTYVGNFVGTDADDEDSTIRIGDVSNGNGAGSLACFIGGIFNNDQPVGENVAVVTLNLLTDQLGVDLAAARSGTAPAVPSRNAPQPRVRPNPSNHAMLNQKVEQLQATVMQQQATVAQQQKQIETLTAQLKEQGAQIQKVSAQLEMVRSTPQVVENR